MLTTVSTVLIFTLIKADSLEKCDPDKLTASVLDLKHLWDFSWLAIACSIKGNHPELVLTARLQTRNHKTSPTDFSVLGLKDHSILEFALEHNSVR